MQSSFFWCFWNTLSESTQNMVACVCCDSQHILWHHVILPWTHQDSLLFFYYKYEQYYPLWGHIHPVLLVKFLKDENTEWETKAYVPFDLKWPDLFQRDCSVFCPLIKSTRKGWPLTKHFLQLWCWCYSSFNEFSWFCCIIPWSGKPLTIFLIYFSEVYFQCFDSFLYIIYFWLAHVMCISWTLVQF